MRLQEVYVGKEGDRVRHEVLFPFFDSSDKENNGSCYLTPASRIEGSYTRWGVVQHHSGFGPDLALVILALVWLVWCVVTVL